MTWKQLKPVLEWGLFYGIVSWILATGITSRIPALAIWMIILSRILTVLIQHFWNWRIPWLRGIVVGLVINLILWGISFIPLGGFAARLLFGWTTCGWILILTGPLFGALFENTLRKMEAAGSEAAA